MTDTTRTTDDRSALAAALRDAIHDTLYHDMDHGAGFRWYWQTDEGTPNDLTEAVMSRLSPEWTLVRKAEVERLRAIEAAAGNALDIIDRATLASDDSTPLYDFLAEGAAHVVDDLRAALAAEEKQP